MIRWSSQKNKEDVFCDGDVYFALRNFFHYLCFISLHRVLNKRLEYLYFYIPKNITSYAFFFLFLKSPKAFSLSLSYQPHPNFFRVFNWFSKFDLCCRFSLATCFVYQSVTFLSFKIEMESRGERYVEIRVSISAMVTNSWRVFGINIWSNLGWMKPGECFYVKVNSLDLLFHTPYIK